MKNKKVVALVATVGVIGVLAIGGTLAWLTSTPDEVVNTFNISTVGGGIDEDDNTDEDPEGDRTDENDYDMVPGKSESKDPTVHMNKKETTVESYIVIEVTEEIKEGLNFSDYITYSVDSAKGWTQLGADYNETVFTGQAGIYYQKYDPATDATKDYEILTQVDTDGDCEVDAEGITYNGTITNEMMKAFLVAQEDGSFAAEDVPQLKFKAHVIQMEGFATVKDALDTTQVLDAE